MKKLYFVLLISGIMVASSCNITRTAGNSGKVPPGQAKKAGGSKSAKPYAPGQQKNK